MKLRPTTSLALQLVAGILLIWIDPLHLSLVYDPQGEFVSWAVNRQFDPPTEYYAKDIRLSLMAGVLWMCVAWEEGSVFNIYHLVVNKRGERGRYLTFIIWL